MDEIYQRIKPLFNEIASCTSCKERQRDGTHAPMLYCVSVDIERCFDTIRPRKLYRMIKKAVLDDEYLIRKHWVYQRSNLTNKGTNSKSRRMPKTSLIFKMERPAFRSGDLQGFDELVANSKKRNGVFLDGVLYDYLPKAKLLNLLKEHLFSNVVQIDDQEFVQKEGIPQGSVLSTLLCNLYYANFERKVIWRHLGNFHPAFVGDHRGSCHHEELMRYTDDFLFVSTNLKRAQTFAKHMHEGNADYGCSINFTKSRVNFELFVQTGENLPCAIPRFDQDPKDARLGWCGMLIDPVRLQVFVNYEK